MPWPRRVPRRAALACKMTFSPTQKVGAMDIPTLRAFFMWCTILNAALLAFSFLVSAALGDLVFKLHGRWFPMSREAFTVAMYSFIGLYKVLVLVFNVIPYLALVILS